MYEPRNRKANSIPILQIEVEHAGGTAKTNPNGILPVDTDVFDPTSLMPLRDLKSIISGLPAVLYCAEDYELAMTPEELFRFMKHALMPAEYFALRDHVGMIHEIHEDFYDPETGAAFQPMDDMQYQKDMGWG